MKPVRGEYIQITFTVPKKEQATQISSLLLERRLAGCIQLIGPIVSTYRWQGKIETAEEWLCLIKSRNDRYEELEQVIKAIHPYETPEIIVTPIIAGNADYLKWLNNTLAQE
ncbi:divalent-cation tolerance protein CutA [Candidatus Bipolaricaulota bacterium]|nr:divalent-cation tolerance protein CutA [Candidatus Bipolaricaulota bacterium]HBR09771.1 cytochrome C biogenesis protein CcdA [Candidatus Acetothermia bacterium]